MSSLVTEDCRSHLKAGNLEVNEKVRELRDKGEEVYHLAFGQSPFPIPDCLVNSLKRNASKKDYVPVTGLYEAREAISKSYQRWEGFDFKPDQIVIGPGSKELIFLLMRIFNGDILVPTPAWTAYAPQVNLAFKDPLLVKTRIEDQWKVMPNNLEEAVKDCKQEHRLLILNYPGNPSGTAYKEDELRALSEVCKKHNVLILSDEIYGRYNPNFASMSKVYKDQTIVTSGLSKWACAGGWRIGFMMFPESLEELKTAVIGAASHTYTCAPVPMQYALAETLIEHFDELREHVDHATRILQGIADYCVTELTTVGVTVTPNQGGYYLFPNYEICRKGLEKAGIMNNLQLRDAILKEARVAVMHGGNFQRPDEELTCNLCFVDFDGAIALEYVKNNPKVKISKEFIQKFAPLVFKGVENLKQFVLKYSN